MHRLCIGMASAVIVAHVVITNKKNISIQKKKKVKNKQTNGPAMHWHGRHCRRGLCCSQLLGKKLN